MMLFPPDQSNLLPYDGTLIDYGCIYDLTTAQIIFDYLMAHTPWQQDEYLKNFGSGKKTIEKHIITDRKVAWYSQSAQTYTYAGKTKQAHAFSPAILKLKTKVEEISGESYNACLLNLYHTGLEGMTWHSDSESEITKGSAIASLSFGAKRKFMFKHKKTKERLDMWLDTGQLIVMKDSIQTHWLHCVPKSKTISEARINLTFRTIS